MCIYSETMMNKFCTYVHMKPSMIPFYIGKGTFERANNLDPSCRNKWHGRIVAKYGKENIIVEVISCKTEHEAFLREKLAIKSLRSKGIALCNITDGGEGGSGVLWREAIKRAMSTPEARKNNSLSKIGIKKPSLIGNKNSEGNIVSVETRQKQSIGIRAALSRPEIKSKMGVKGNNNRLGHKHSAETKSKISEAHKGRKRPLCSEEQRANYAKGSKGNKNAAGKRTPEQCARNSEAQKKYNELRKSTNGAMK